MNLRACFRAIALLGVATLCAAQQPRTPPPQEPRIRVEVNLVTLLASVTDANGRPVPDLQREAFEIYEEGVRQKLELFDAETSQPLDLVLMIDSSMSALKELNFELEAAAHFVRQVVRPGDRLSVFQFAESVEQLAAFSDNVPELQAAVRSVVPGAGTSLYDAVYLGSDALRKRPLGRRRVIVLVTDAGETTSNTNFEDTRRAAIRAEALLYTIVIRAVKSDTGRNTAGEHALVTITDATGGTLYYPDAVAELDAIFERIDRELRTQYRLGYYPTPRPPARSFRRIELRVNLPGASRAQAARPAPAPGAAPLPPGYTLRYRKGYFTSGVLD